MAKSRHECFLPSFAKVLPCVPSVKQLFKCCHTADYTGTWAPTFFVFFFLPAQHLVNCFVPVTDTYLGATFLLLFHTTSAAEHFVVKFPVSATDTHLGATFSSSPSYATDPALSEVFSASHRHRPGPLLFFFFFFLPT
jgi:hypothetical protein